MNAHSARRHPKHFSVISTPQQPADSCRICKIRAEVRRKWGAVRRSRNLQSSGAQEISRKSASHNASRAERLYSYVVRTVFVIRHSISASLPAGERRMLHGCASRLADIEGTLPCPLATTIDNLSEFGTQGEYLRRLERIRQSATQVGNSFRRSAHTSHRHIWQRSGRFLSV